MVDELSNKLFFRLYQTANMLNKVGSRALESEQITTQQWSIIGALSRETVCSGMTVSELCDYLMVSRQNMTGLLSRLEERQLLTRTIDPSDNRSRRISLTNKGKELWDVIKPLINDFYDHSLQGMSFDDRIACVHYMNKLLQNMKRLDKEQNT
ncbi:MarR family winged helix-turn-helix transcriptional regulator [Sneathiella sp.]|jgi:DNA-binding MarR family transcriptional regulator|uniref:MarR family winged helix-turn-helix transcriptional regulator n=1 Tax=Sneathiella sp. TaxID=1964365 RepID=UPI0039E58CAA